MPVNSGGITDPIARIRRLLRTQEPEIRRAFMLAVEEIRNSQTLEQLAFLIENGNIETFMASIRPAAQILATTYSTVVTESALSAAEFISNNVTTGNFAFDRAKSEVFRVLQDEQLRLITIFDQQQREVIRETLQDSFTRGINPKAAARELRDSIGLTARQQRTVQRYRSLLTGRANGLPSRQVFSRALRDRRFDRSIERSLSEGIALTEQQIEKMVGRYRQRFINFHAETVARTEALSAVHQGNDLVYRQAIDEGQFAEDEVIRTWVTAADERVRGSHKALNGQKRSFADDEPWHGFNGDLHFPGDPRAPLSETARCRCILTIRILDP